MRHLLYFLIFIIQLSVFSQTGDFILTHHSSRLGGSSVNFQIAADTNGIISLANRFGLLKYDGADWDIYPTSSSVLSLAIDKSNRTFLGGIGEFGQMVLKENSYQYEALIENDSIRDHFLQTLINDGFVFFLSNENLYSYEPKTKETKHLASRDYLNAYEFDGQIFVNTNEATYRIEGGQLVVQQESKYQWVAIKSSVDGSHTYGLDLDGRLFKLDNDKPSLLAYNKQLKDAGIELSDFEWVNDSLLACSTVNAGVLFFNANNPKYLKAVNYYSGLPDNEILDVFTDRNGGTWVIHSAGLSRIAPLFPASNYSNFDGLEGNLIEAKRIDDVLWINSSLGVYYFKQDTSFRNKNISTPAVKKTATKNSLSSTTKSNKKDRKKGFFKNLISRNKKSPSEKQKPKKGGGFLNRVFRGNQEEEPSHRQIEKIITGVSYEFVKVPGTEEKFDQLLEFQNQVLSTSHSGVYAIRKESAELVIEGIIRLVFVVPKSNHLLIATEDGALETYSFADNTWELLSSQEVEDVILKIYADKHGHIWVAGASSIYKLDAEDYSLQSQININNRFLDEISFWESEGKLHLVNSEGIFELDEETNTVKKSEKLSEQIGKPRVHIQDERRVWVFNGKVWYLLAEVGTITKHQYLGVFPRLKGITSDDEKLWLITADNHLLSFLPEKDSLRQATYPLFIKRLVGTNGELSVQDQFLLDHDQNYLSIQFLKPDYMGVLNHEYQYRLKGLNTEWSKWTNAGLIDYSFIPPGKYELLVRVRDTFDETGETSMLRFKVNEPYWKKSWFYLIQVLVLSLIIGISSKLNQDKLYNRLLKSALSVLTLVVIIEFLQSIMSAYIGIESTPVVGFLIDVSTAIFVFPLEWILRKIMLEGGMSIFKKGDMGV